ncbi:MAG: site-specific integrase, partial [Niabella sp.]
MKRATIRPELYITRLNKQGFAPVRLVCQYRQDRKIIPTDLKVRPANWSVKDRAAIYIKPGEFKKLQSDPNNTLPSSYSLMPLEKDVAALNNKLRGYISNLEGIEDGLIKKGNYTISDLVIEYKKQYGGRGVIESDPQHSVTDFIDDYVKRNEGLIKFRTLQAYTNLNNHLKNYSAKKKDKPVFEKLTYSKMKAIHAYLIETGINNTTIAKLISTLKTLIKAAVREDKAIQVCPDFRDYSVTRKDSDHEVIALSQDEFNALMDLDLSDYSKQDYYLAGGEQVAVSYKTLDKARDLFIFSCVTGLRYSDVASLKREHIREGFIYKKAIKTGQNLVIP